MSVDGVLGVARSMADRASRKPPSEVERDGESDGDEGVDEVPFRPRGRALRLDPPILPRGENAATVHRR